MEGTGTADRVKKVRIIEPTIGKKESSKQMRQLRVVAYCRVSTKQEEQLNSYEVQNQYYTERINSEPEWMLAGIFADKGITGTSVKKRDEFNKMIQLCKRGKVDMIITKSISRFSRNTVDCLQYTRMLKDLSVDVFFEEQGIHSMQAGAEFYITIYGSIAQSESENISANVRWGKEQSAKAGNVIFRYDRFLGYRKGENGAPEIDVEQAEIVRFIYKRYLAGDSLIKIVKRLEELKISSPGGKENWSSATIKSILSNEKYKGDAIINKTYISDCLTKKVKINNGERPKYYVENNHAPIIDAETFSKVREEMARRSSKPKIKRIGTKSEQGRYCSKYALTELLICGECKTPYRRCTWTASGTKKVVWRCISRLDFGKKYCHHSPSIEEGVLQKAIMAAVLEMAEQNSEVLKTLNIHIGMGLNREPAEDNSFDIQIRIAEIEAEIKSMISAVSADTLESFDEQKAVSLDNEKKELQQKLEQLKGTKLKEAIMESRLDEIFVIVDSLKNHPLTYDDELVRQILSEVIVLSKERIRIVFKEGFEKIQPLIDMRDKRVARLKKNML